MDNNEHLDFGDIIFDNMVQNQNGDYIIPQQNDLNPVIPINDNNDDNSITQNDNVNNGIVNANDNSKDKYIVPLTILEKSCSANDVMGIVVSQINGLQQDIKDLEDMREMLRMTMAMDDPKSWRSTFIVENRLKTFTGFYSTILSYKKELNDMLLKLRAILTDSNNLGDQVKDAIKEALMKREEVAIKVEDNKKRLQELVEQAPGLMPTSL